MNCNLPEKSSASKRFRKFISIFLAVLLILNLVACSKPEPAGDEPLVVEREAGPVPQQMANQATAIALKNYIYARILTEEFLGTEAQPISIDDALIMMDELYAAWETADAVAVKAVEITDQAVLLLEGSANGSRLGLDRLAVLIKTIESKVFDSSGIAYAGAPTIDRETWAENLAKQYDALRGAKRYQQLAKQLGTDTKTAVEQMTLASKILRNAADLEEAQAEAAEYNRSLNVVTTYKTASKVGLFVGATIATGGGSLASLAGSSMTVGGAAAVVVGGVDCIVDVGQTTSTIVLGEDHQVTVGFKEASVVISPVSAVVGLVTLDPTKAEGVIAFVGESMMEWFNPGSITAIAVEAYKEGKTRVTAQIIKAAEGMSPDVEKALNSMGISLPKQIGTTSTQLKLLHKVNSEASMAAMEKLAVEIYEQEPVAAEVPPAAVEPAPAEEPKDTKPVGKTATYEIKNVSGTSSVMDFDTDPIYFDDVDAIDVTDFTVGAGESTGGWIDVVTLLESGALTELSPTTYSVTVYIGVGEIPADEEEQYVYLNPAYGQTAFLHTVTITGTYGENEIIEWDGASFTQVK
jgi:hypothetical protein